jgi:hypothetical protein
VDVVILLNALCTILLLEGLSVTVVDKIFN